MAYSSRFDHYTTNKKKVRASTRAALDSLDAAVLSLDDPIPPFDEYMQRIHQDNAAGPRSGPTRRHMNPTPERQAEEELRRSYRERYGGDYTLQRYREIAREDARFSKYRRNEPMRVVHRRGDFDIVTERRPQETAVGAVENQYWVAMAQEEACARMQETPYRYEAPPDRRDHKKTRTYTEQEFEKHYEVLRMTDEQRPAATPAQYRHKDHRGVDCFRIPASNRDKDQYRVKGYVAHPKLTYEEPRETFARPRGMYKGKEIRKLPEAEKPAANRYFDYF